MNFSYSLENTVSQRIYRMNSIMFINNIHVNLKELKNINICCVYINDMRSVFFESKIYCHKT